MRFLNVGVGSIVNMIHIIAIVTPVNCAAQDKTVANRLNSRTDGEVCQCARVF
jgi:regulator of extracellular matrix RemA (YlzA/DUF370 family)